VKIIGTSRDYRCRRRSDSRCVKKLGIPSTEWGWRAKMEEGGVVPHGTAMVRLLRVGGRAMEMSKGRDAWDYVKRRWSRPAADLLRFREEMRRREHCDGVALLGGDGISRWQGCLGGFARDILVSIPAAYRQCRIHGTCGGKGRGRLMTPPVRNRNDTVYSWNHPAGSRTGALVSKGMQLMAHR